MSPEILKSSSEHNFCYNFHREGLYVVVVIRADALNILAGRKLHLLYIAKVIRAIALNILAARPCNLTTAEPRSPWKKQK